MTDNTKPWPTTTCHVPLAQANDKMTDHNKTQESSDCGSTSYNKDKWSVSSAVEQLLKESRGGLLHKRDTWCRLLEPLDRHYCEWHRRIIGQLVSQIRRLRDDKTLAPTRAAKTIYGVLCASTLLGWLDTTVFHCSLEGEPLASGSSSFQHHQQLYGNNAPCRDSHPLHWTHLLHDAVLGGHLDLLDKVRHEGLFELEFQHDVATRSAAGTAVALEAPIQTFVRRLHTAIAAQAKVSSTKGTVMSAWRDMAELYPATS